MYGKTTLCIVSCYKIVSPSSPGPDKKKTRYEISCNTGGAIRRIHQTRAAKKIVLTLMKNYKKKNYAFVVLLWSYDKAIGLDPIDQ